MTKTTVVALLLLLAGFAPTQAAERTDWTRTDTGLQLAYSAVLIADWSQTLRIARSIKNIRENPTGGVLYYYERNSMTQRSIGKYPAKRNVNVHFATSLLGHAAISYLLPKPYRTIWQSAYIFYEYDIVKKNRDIGLGLSLHF